MPVCKKLITTVVLYRTLWGCGAVLLLSAIPLYRQSAAFYSLIALGFMLMLLGILAWVRHQTRACESSASTKARRGTDGNACRSTNVYNEDVQAFMDGGSNVAILASIGKAPTDVELTPKTPDTAVLIAPVTASTALPETEAANATTRISALRGKKSSRRRHATGVKLSENAAVKEFSKFEASNEVAKKTVRSVATKRDGKAPRTSSGTALLTVAAAEGQGQKIGCETEDPFASLFATPSKAARFVYPTVEDIRTERERHAHRPETPDIDRKRRTSMLKEYAMQLGHPRDGSLLPLVQ